MYLVTNIQTPSSGEHLFIFCKHLSFLECCFIKLESHFDQSFLFGEIYRDCGREKRESEREENKIRGGEGEELEICMRGGERRV